MLKSETNMELDLENITKSLEFSSTSRDNHIQLLKKKVKCVFKQSSDWNGGP